MIIEAIAALKERTGSSLPAIAKHIESKYKTGLPSNFKKLLSAQLKKLVEKNKLIQIKNSFKLAETLKKPASSSSVKSEPKPRVDVKRDAEKKKKNTNLNRLNHGFKPFKLKSFKPFKPS